MTFFKEEFGFDAGEVDESDIDIDVRIGRRSINFVVGIPVVVEVRGAQSVGVTAQSHTIDIDFRRMYENVLAGTKSAVYNDWDDIEVDLLRYARERLALDFLDYSIERRKNEISRNDVYIITHDYDTIDGEPYEFRFAVGNRKPVMSEINYAPDNERCEVEVPEGTNMTIDPEVADPDSHDDLEIFVDEDSAERGWKTDGKIVHKEAEVGDHETTVEVYVTDGELENYQPVRVCVDEDVDLDHDPHVLLHYDYEGFDALAEDGVQRITMEDPIELRTSPSFSAIGIWTIGNGNEDHCTITTSSSCVIFPGFADCSEGFEPKKIEDIYDKFKDCGLAHGPESITFDPIVGDEIEVSVEVEECLPHEATSPSPDNMFLSSNVCCNDDFTFVTSEGFAYEDERLYCGYPELSGKDDVFDDRANNVYNVEISAQCMDHRGNYFEDAEEQDIALEKPYPDIPQGIRDEGLEGRRCSACSPYGGTGSIDERIFDYEWRLSNHGTFESSVLEDYGYVCDPRPKPVEGFEGSGRGFYDPDNDEGALMVLECKGACNDGVCDYAVDCTCTKEYGGEMPSVCDGMTPGEETGTCTQSGENHFPDQCNTMCETETASNTFRCVDDDHDGDYADCTYCDLACDGREPEEIIPSCNQGEYDFLYDMCDAQGNVVDVMDDEGIGECVYSPSHGCNAAPDCSGAEIYQVLDQSTQEEKRADMCNDACQVVASDVCYGEEVESLCQDRTVGEGFDHTGAPVDSEFCDGGCSYQTCGNFAYKGGDACMDYPTVGNCCYSEEDVDDNHDVVCNLNDPDTTVDDCVSA